MRYSEELARLVFKANPTLATENEILDAGFEIARVNLGSDRRARAVFAYDEDFAGDFLDEFNALKGA